MGPEGNPNPSNEPPILVRQTDIFIVNVNNWADIGNVRLAFYGPAKSCPKPWVPEDDIKRILAKYKIKMELKKKGIKVTPEAITDRMKSEETCHRTEFRR